MKLFILKHPCDKIIGLLVMLAFLNLITGCYYYKVKTLNPPIQFSKDVDQISNPEKYVIIHFEEKVWQLVKVELNKKTISGKPVPLEGHEYYKKTNPNKANRYRKTYSNDESDVLNEVHIYINSYTKHNDDKIEIPLKSIQKIELYSPDSANTVASFFFTSVAVVSGVLAVIYVIAILTKSSCPFIYVFNGENFNFLGEIYSGAIQPALERNDYLLLKDIKPDNGVYKLRITNEVHEIQHTNLTELILFNEENIYMDKYGKAHLVEDIKTPVQAENLTGTNILPLIEKPDSLYYFNNKIGKDQSSLDGMFLSFTKSDEQHTAKLVIKAKNSFWLDYLFSQFHEMFGESYYSFQEKQATKSKEELIEWYMEQSLPISIYIERNGNWEFLDYYNLVGPMAFKDDILSIDISDIDTEMINIKLEYGYLFWEIDFVGIDYTKNSNINYIIIPVESAIDNAGTDRKEQLIQDDSLYYIQTEIGEAATLIFPIPNERIDYKTIYLHSKGYYSILRDQKGRMKKNKLKSFQEPGSFPVYSKELFLQIEKQYND